MGLMTNRVLDRSSTGYRRNHGVLGKPRFMISYITELERAGGGEGISNCKLPPSAGMWI